jgi:hypothetical protein
MTVRGCLLLLEISASLGFRFLLRCDAMQVDSAYHPAIRIARREKMTAQQLVLNLEQILDLVGPLDDVPGENTPRERFRRYLANSVGTIGAVRDYLETCLRTSGTPYNRALQDLVNHTGRLIGFDVEFGRYQGVRGEIGHDGLWRAW